MKQIDSKFHDKIYLNIEVLDSHLRWKLYGQIDDQINEQILNQVCNCIYDQLYSQLKLLIKFKNETT